MRDGPVSWTSTAGLLLEDDLDQIFHPSITNHYSITRPTLIPAWREHSPSSEAIFRPRQAEAAPVCALCSGQLASPRRPKASIHPPTKYRPPRHEPCIVVLYRMHQIEQHLSRARDAECMGSQLVELGGGGHQRVRSSVASRSRGCAMHDWMGAICASHAVLSWSGSRDTAGLGRGHRRIAHRATLAKTNHSTATSLPSTASTPAEYGHPHACTRGRAGAQARQGSTASLRPATTNLPPLDAWAIWRSGYLAVHRVHTVSGPGGEPRARGRDGRVGRGEGVG